MGLIEQRSALMLMVLSFLALWCHCSTAAVTVGQTGLVSDSKSGSLSYTDEELKSGRHCPQSLPKLPILPGRGWDNLLNQEMGQLTENTYRRCKTTDDGSMLIPDGAFLIPIRQSSLGLQSELIDHWSNYTEVTTRTINVQARSDNSLFSASGSFSSDYQRAKQHQVDDKTVTSRVYYRSTLYVIGYEPSVQLDPTFKRLLLEAEAVLTSESVIPVNSTSTAFEFGSPNYNKSDLLLELIVRDYGTHSLSRIDLGAILYKEDFLTRNLDFSSDSVRQGYQVAASLSFGKLFGFSASYSDSTTTVTTQQYESQTMASYVSTIGGGQVHTNMSVNSWLDTVPSNLVAVDRAGDPLHFLITPQALPELSLGALRRLTLHLKGATDRYYARNTRYGCIQMDSPNFDYHANVMEDNSCKSPTNNYTLGGLFEQCVSLQDEAGDICILSRDQLQKNPKTGMTSCPGGYQAVALLTKELHHAGEACHTRGWWIFSYTSCHATYSVARIESYWCAAIGGHAPGNNTGYMFGGLYSTRGSSQVNPVTNSQSCPPTFVALHLTNADIYVCVGDDYELGYKFSIPFGGLFSCGYGNPLFTDLKQVGLQVTVAKATTMVTGVGAPGDRLQPQVQLPGDFYTKACPNKFTQHVAEITDGCEVNYCVAAGSFTLHGHLPILRPPFHDIVAMYAESAALKLRPGTDTRTGREGGSSAGLVVGILVGVVAAVGLPAAFAVYWRRVIGRRARAGYTEIATAEFDGNSNTGLLASRVAHEIIEVSSDGDIQAEPGVATTAIN